MSTSTSQRIQIRASNRQRSSADGALDSESFSAVGTDGEAIAHLPANRAPGQLIQQQLPLSNLVLLDRSQARHDEPVAGLDVELVARSPAGGM